MLELLVSLFLWVGYCVMYPIWHIVAFLRHKTFEEVWAEYSFQKLTVCTWVGLAVTLPAVIALTILVVKFFTEHVTVH